MAIAEQDVDQADKRMQALRVDGCAVAARYDRSRSRNWMARQSGANGGRVQSTARRAAARKNGCKGGRPKKMPAEEDHG